MRAAERLVRNLCEAKREQIEQDRRDAIEKAREIPYEVPIRTLPVPVQKIFKRLHDAQAIVARTTRLLKSHGYQASYADRARTRARFTTDRKNAAQTLANERATKRMSLMKRLRTEAAVDVLGRTPEEARARLERLRKDLTRV